MKNHRARLHKQLEDYVQNHLPIHLLRLKDITLVHRSEVQNQIRHRIKENNLKCQEHTCQCFEKLKKDMQFAILSHRWSEDEISFHDLSDTTKPASGVSAKLLRTTLVRARSKQEGTILWRLHTAGSSMPVDCGFTKLVKLCEIAINEDCNFAWLDTVCINKESSAELEESIRSMFGWYRDSHVCIVHLAQTFNWRTMEGDPWFKRGWTLQELLAPPSILFFDGNWGRLTNRRNDKDVGNIEQENPPLIKFISRITRIPIEDLIHFKPGLHDIRKRLSWASSRETTRVEDKAYSLIGIFGIGISVAYGERENAFYRLQVEILQRSDDKGLFHWQGEASGQNSMLAVGPQCFRSIEIDEEITHEDTISDYTYMLTNRGLRISLMVYQPTDKVFKDTFKALGNPNSANKAIGILAQTKAGTCLAVVLEKTGTSRTQKYKRVDLIHSHVLSPIALNREPIEIFIA